MSCFRFIAAEKASYPISLLCRMLDVSRSGFHAWERRAPSSRDLADAWLLERVREIHGESRGTYNAVAESFFATLEKDLLRRTSFATRQDARTAVFDYIETFYNPIRLRSTLGYRSPIEYEKITKEAKAA